MPTSEFQINALINVIAKKFPEKLVCLCLTNQWGVQSNTLGTVRAVLICQQCGHEVPITQEQLVS